MSKGTKSIAFYLMMILIFGSLMYFIAKEGESQQLENSIASIQNAPSNLEEGFTIFTQLLVHNIESSIGILLLQIITILPFVRLVIPEDRATYRHRRDRCRNRARAVRIRQFIPGGFRLPFPCGIVGEYKYAESIRTYTLYVRYRDGT